jgi:hypothetical protein
MERIPANAARSRGALAEKLRRRIARGARHPVMCVAAPGVPAQIAQFDGLVALRPELDTAVRNGLAAAGGWCEDHPARASPEGEFPAPRVKAVQRPGERATENARRGARAWANCTI